MQTSTHTERKVFCEVDSVTMSEFFEGGRSGLTPEYRMRLFAPEYKGEQLLRYNNELYSIYRTYVPRNDVIELYVEKKKGDE